ncbi:MULTISPECIES: precorrin-8X methylmutase [Thalassospira]|uniref:Precorrin isomerase n=2 Tax=Thalassospira tepidiphila TaxID=393657 RepID=A0A853L316_9PROT|nr:MULTISPECIES: precorrin-8X methylmutase [Thalassospira]MBO6579346.1 precorrin-8X methylmutase [Thalassospira sp.]MBO6801924.1 precorrin-8X methylmutase [Thalassospira sp.]MBO6817996.1 precorrin-8X methylmutase [Thalassospira sp.]MBO6886631.1 precorrin-8X methylmutase [Thalassospira sp.]NJB73158.1 precorrin-8X/cobalt-precorrin-8 methylmutase [Thalassospira tepidiphila]
MFDYLRDPQEIYAKSFATIEAEANLARFSDAERPVAIRIIHACGMVEMADQIAFGGNVVNAATAALSRGKPILCDAEMVRHGIISRLLPSQNPVLCTLNDGNTHDLAARMETTRSAAAVEAWADHIEGAIIAIGNAPTALFHLLEAIHDGRLNKPAAIVGMPVGFVGATESKDALIEHANGIPFVTLRGRFGGSAVAAATINALARLAREDETTPDGTFDRKSGGAS